MPFKGAIPKKAFLLLFAALAAWVAAAVYTFWLNPEVRLYKAAIEKKRAWVRRLDHDYPKKTVVYGGSSCAFSIDGERMENLHGIPAANFGLHVGFGAQFLTSLAFEECHPGDTLVVALEPDLLATSLARSSLAVQMSYALGEPHLSRDITRANARQSWASDLFEFRPGAQFTFTMIAKMALGRPAYRYRIDEVHPSGWQTTPARIALHGPPGLPPGLSPETSALLKLLRAHCDERIIRIVYSMPWGYTPPEMLSERRLACVQFLRQISTVVPALRDPMLGSQPDATLFSDSGWHLVERGIALRTDVFARLLKEEQYWDEPSLAEAERELRAGDYRIPANPNAHNE